MRKLVAVLAEVGLDAVYGLKIDIEGHEDRALVPFLDEGPAHVSFSLSLCCFGCGSKLLLMQTLDFSCCVWWERPGRLVG